MGTSISNLVEYFIGGILFVVLLVATSGVDVSELLNETALTSIVVVFSYPVGLMLDNLAFLVEEVIFDLLGISKIRHQKRFTFLITSKELGHAVSIALTYQSSKRIIRIFIASLSLLLISLPLCKVNDTNFSNLLLLLALSVITYGLIERSYTKFLENVFKSLKQ